MLAKIAEFVKTQLSWAKNNLDNIIVIAMVVLFVLLSFASGYIIAKYQDRTPITINQAK